MGRLFLSLAQSFKKVVRKKLRRWLTRFCPKTCCRPKYEHRFAVNLDLQKVMIDKR